MRIAITGAHRTGKTSLAQSLSEALPGYELKEEPYHELEAEGYGFSEMPVADDFIKMLDHSIEQLEESGDNVIFDRSPLDQLAYIEALGDPAVHDQYKMVKDSISEIDLLICVPIEEPDRIGCLKDEHPDLRIKVDVIINDWINDFEVKTIKVSGTVAERIEQVLKHVN